MGLISYCFEPNEAFNGRNKAYGAYRLRAAYSRRLSLALLAGITLFTAAVSSPVLLRGDTPATQDPPPPFVFDFTTYDVPELPVLPPARPPSPPPPPIAADKFLPPEVRPDDENIEFSGPPDQSRLDTVLAGTTSIEGPATGNTPPFIPDELVASPVVPMAPPDEDKVFTGVLEQQPQFPGGMDALAKFLQQEVRYPEIARKAGVQGKVFVQFVVGKDGAIRDVTVVRGQGGGLDEEAVRVVQAMPSWIPGKQNGRAVSVRFSMPITFRLR